MDKGGHPVLDETVDFPLFLPKVLDNKNAKINKINGVKNKG